MKKFIRCEFNSDLKNVIMARGIISGFFLDEEIDLAIINEVKTIISEAVTNSIIHVYKEKEGTIKIGLELENNLLSIEVTDEGCGIENIEKAKQPLFSTQENKERAGLGFTIMEIFSDSMNVESKVGVGTSVKLTKYIS